MRNRLLEISKLIEFSRQEALAVLVLSAALIVGTGVSILDHLNDQRFADFHVIPQAVDVPPAVELASQGPVALNAADAEALQRLPQIGPKTAAAIVE